MTTRIKEQIKRDRNMILENGQAERLVSIKILRSLRPLGFLQARDMVDTVLRIGRVPASIKAAYTRNIGRVDLGLLA
jgi:ribosomal protein L7/L12